MNMCCKTLIVPYMNTIGYDNERGAQVTGRITDFE